MNRAQELKNSFFSGSGASVFHVLVFALDRRYAQFDFSSKN
jgi:hypothetical protein